MWDSVDRPETEKNALSDIEESEGDLFDILSPSPLLTLGGGSRIAPRARFTGY
jgi:hypothetical protein